MSQKKKKKKLRVALRKNTQRRSRRGDLTRQVLEQGVEDADLLQGERISGKGDLTRHRTVIAEVEDETGQILRDVDTSDCLPGRVLSAAGLNSFVQTPDGRQFECTLRRVLRNLERDQRNAVVTGDHVLFRVVGDDQGVIERVEPRQSTLSRGQAGREHVLVSNVDQVLIVTSAADPPLKPNLIDRFLISAEKGEVDSIVCINKIDLVDPVELQPLAGLYGRLGYEVVLTSATDGRGVERLRHLLTERQTVLTGQSGVGKSSLLNALDPSLNLRTTRISNWSGKGQHTTRRAVMLPLEFGGWVVDTPGIRQMELWDVIPEEVEAYFVEFRPFVAQCRFPDCTHTHETGCGVKQAVDRKLIAGGRYESYVRIVTGV